MDTQELLKKVRKIEIKSKGLTNHIFAGEYHSAFKGKGMAFSEVREYQFGDDIRNIDWNVTARFNKPYIKVFEEERELTVMLLIDVSASKDFGTQQKMKRDLIAELSAVISFSAVSNNDKIGAIFFSDKIEKFISPKKGKKHILRIIREILYFEPESKGTDVSEALRYLTNVIKKRSTSFIISDFICVDYSTALKIAKHKHDLIALNVNDLRETELPDVGLINFVDAETGVTRWIDTSNKTVRENFAKNAKNAFLQMSETFRKCGVDFTTIRTDEDYVKPLIRLFKHRK